MSEVHDQAIHLLAAPQFGTYLTPEGREMVPRALDEVDSLRRRAEKAEQNAKMWEARAELGVSVLKGIFGKDSPAAPKEDVEVPSDTPLPTEPAGDVSPGAT